MKLEIPLSLIPHMVPMEGLIEIADGLIEDVGGLVEAAAGVGIVVVVVIVAIVSRLSIPKILMVGLAAGLAYWFVMGGAKDMGDGVESEFDTRKAEGASAPIVQTYTPPTHKTGR